MFQWVLGQRTGAKAAKIDPQTLIIEIPVRVRGKDQIDTIDLKPHLKAYIEAQKAQ